MCFVLRDLLCTAGCSEAEAAALMARHRSLVRVDLRGCPGGAGAILHRASPKAQLARCFPLASVNGRSGGMDLLNLLFHPSSCC